MTARTDEIVDARLRAQQKAEKRPDEQRANPGEPDKRDREQRHHHGGREVIEPEHRVLRRRAGATPRLIEKISQAQARRALMQGRATAKLDCGA
jgi:hypothetical protein